MSNQAKNIRIQTLEPSKLSESIKSKNEEEKLNTGALYENYYKTFSASSQSANEGLHRHVFTKTQQIYEVSDPQQSERKIKKTHIQVDKLNQLKKQYEILKNIKIDDSIIYHQKVSKKQTSSVEASQNNSVRSVHTNSKQQQQQKNNGLIQYQKKQLEMMLANCMNKIQQLLKAQVEYKRRIYDLTRLNPEVPNDKWQQKLKVAHSTQKANLQTIQKLRFQEQKLRNINFNLTQRIRSIESENFNYQTQNRRMGEQKRKLHESLMLEKEAHMNTKIEIKRYQLEKDMIEKQKNNEVERSKRTVKDLNTEIERLNTKIKKYESQISELNERVRTLTRELTIETYRKDNNQQKSQKSVKEYIEAPKKSEQKSESSSDNFQKKLLAKIMQLEKAEEEEARKQLNNLREEIENMNFKQDDHNQRNQLELRITALQKIINEDNQEKMGFLQELRRIIKDFQELQMENEDLKDKIRKLQRQLNLEKENSAYHMDRLQKSHRIISAASNSDDINNYLTKIRRLESENRDLRVKLQRMQDSFSNSESRIEQKIREYSRKLDQSQMQVQRLLKQNQFNLQLAQQKYKSEIELYRNQAARASKQKSLQQHQYQQLRNTLQLNISSLQSQQNKQLQSLSQKLSQKQSQLHELKKQNEQNSNRIKKEYEKQLFTLLSRLDQLIKSNQRYVLENTRLIHCQSSLYQLRGRVKKFMGLSDSVDHLWQVKEIEYFNLNQLLKEIKGNP